MNEGEVLMRKIKRDSAIESIILSVVCLAIFWWADGWNKVIEAAGG